MGKLGAAIAAENLQRKGPACTVGVALSTLAKADAADLRAALADPGIACTALSRALRAVDVVVSGTTLSRHRKGDCGCAR
jgi:hypothetical protein